MTNSFTLISYDIIIIKYTNIHLNYHSFNTTYNTALY